MINNQMKNYILQSNKKITYHVSIDLVKFGLGAKIAKGAIFRGWVVFYFIRGQIATS